MLSSKLDTLRDMTEESHVDPSSLAKVKELGAGAFATGWLFGSPCDLTLLCDAFDRVRKCYES